MPEDFSKDSTSKIYGIRRGEPKRPESLIEIPSMVPEVPEVSLCFNQEKNQPLQPNKASNFEVAARDGNHHHNVKQHQNEMLHRNQYESYNTWKAKHSKALHDITSGMENGELVSKRVCSAKRSAGIVRKQNSGNEILPPPMIASKYYNHGSMEVNSHSNSSSECSPRINAQQVPTTNQSGGHQHTNQAVNNHPFPPQHVRDSQLAKENLKIPRPASNFQNHRGFKDRNIEHIPCTYQMIDKLSQNGNPVFCVPNYCNKQQCSCGKQNTLANPSNGNQYFNENPILTDDDARANAQFLDTAKVYSPLEFGLMNSHLSNLFQIINIQKEQISMLCQEVSAQKMIMSSLFEEVRQIHAAVSLNPVKCNTPSSTENKPSQCCNSDCKNDQNVSRNKKSEDSMNGKIKHNGNSTSNQSALPPHSVEKRSVGVMTSSLDNSVDTPPCNGKDKTHRVRENVKEVKKQKPSSPPSHDKNLNRKTNKKAQPQMDKKRKPQSNHIHRRKNKKEESDESSQSEDSFSLDEAAVVVRTEPEACAGDVSPEVSIHVNMPDYSASSSESGTSNSSDSEDEGQESGTEGESSDPQIGWTFYDRVVGQVNNMLKKPSSDPRHEYPPNRRRNAGNVLYQCNEDYETENNWSKRVTFDGPPLDDSDNNGLHVPRYHHFRGNQDYRIPGGSERVKDFLMCDYANGGNNLSSANVSFATYRYYQRHQLLPPPPPPEQVFPEAPQMKKKNKTRKSEKTPPMSHKSGKRRSGGPPSKILDMSALKNQPKLF